MGSEDTTGLWYDREVRFDMLGSELGYRRGEVTIDSIQGVEDTKGNNGERGSMSITNLRIIWVSARVKSCNISIGYNTLLSMSVRSAASRLRGNTQALYVICKHERNRFEFIFTNLHRDSPRLFSTVQAVYRAYETSRLYRELKLRGALIQTKELKVLPEEIVYDKIDGVWNLSNEQGHLGTIFVSNLRCVWHANMAENFNVSIPYLQVQNIRIAKSKFGKALVIETSPESGAYVLGFRVEPLDKLNEMFQQVKALHRAYTDNPNFGVSFEVEETMESLEKRTVERILDDVEIVDDAFQDSEAVQEHVASRYITEGGYGAGGEGGAAEPVRCPRLGLRIEPLPAGVTTEDLWRAL